MALKARTIGEAIVEIMEQTSSPRTGVPPMSRVELGNLLDVTPSNLSRITNPRVNQRAGDDLLKRLAKAFPHLTSYAQLVRLREQSPEPAPRKKAGEKASATKATKAAAPAKAAKPPAAAPAEKAGRTAAAPLPAREPARAGRGVALPRASTPGASGEPGPTRRAVATPTGHRPAPRPASFRTEPAALRETRVPPAASATASAAPAEAAPPDAQTTAAPQPPPRRGRAPTSLVGAHLATISMFAHTLQTDDASGVIASPAVRYAVAASLAVGELERVAGENHLSTDTQAAAAALLNDLWRIAARTRHGDREEIRPLATEERERQKLETFLSASPERMDAYRRLCSELPHILFPDGMSDADGDELRTVLLRSLTLGARR